MSGTLRVKETDTQDITRDVSGENPLPITIKPAPKVLWSLRYTRLSFFWLRFWNLYYFFVSYVKILRFYQKIFLIGLLLGEVRFFRVVLGLRRMKKNWVRSNFFFFICEPFIWAKTSFSEIRSNNCAGDGFKSQSWAKIGSKFIPLSLRLSGIEFSLVSD